jgi:hypothetical protein
MDIFVSVTSGYVRTPLLARMRTQNPIPSSHFIGESCDPELTDIPRHPVAAQDPEDGWVRPPNSGTDPLRAAPFRPGAAGPSGAAPSRGSVARPECLRTTGRAVCGVTRATARSRIGAVHFLEAVIDEAVVCRVDLSARRVTQLSLKVADGRRAPSTRDTYRRKLDTHALPALGEVRLGEVTTALVDSVLQSIKASVGAPTAKSSRSVISGILSLAARHGAIATNPVRDADSIPAAPKRRPRALDETERREWFAMLEGDPKAVASDLPDLCTFLLATGARIGEALDLLWSEVDLSRGEIQITAQVIRIRGQGLVRGPTKSAAGQRLLVLPGWCVEMLSARASEGIRSHEPVFL